MKKKLSKCIHCGIETIRYFERIKKELKNKSSKQLIPVGIAYKVAV